MKDSPRDLRDFARATQRRLLLGGLALLFGVGGLLIYLFYGPAGAVLGLVCLAVGLLPVGLIGVALWVVEAVARKDDED
jgi:hypothetical protein